MRMPQARLTRQRKASMKHMPAPVGGLNVRDSIADMPAEDAVIMTNMFPLPDRVMLRKGHIAHATGLGAQVEAVVDYNSATGSELYAATAADIFDVSTAGAVGAAVVTGQTSGKWQHINFATAALQYLYMVNGTDSAQLYNGTTWQAVTAVSAPIAITGIATTSLIHVNAHAQRLFFVEKNSLRFWYLPVDVVGGAAVSFDLTSLCVKGGYLMAMYSWTLDAGYGLDDHAVFITSEGEVLIYRGIDPGTAADWVLVGIFAIGRPIGRRCGIQFGSDLLVICEDGIIQLSKSLISSKVASKTAISDKIQTAITNLVTQYATVFGWQSVVLARQNILILNVPNSATGSIQYAMNTQTGAWAYWEGMNGNAWCEQDGSLYFGGNGIVFQAWTGVSDYFAGDATGQNINGEVLQAFSYMGTQNLKQYQLARPIISIDTASIGVLFGVNVDFDETPPTGSLSFPPSTAGIWDSSVWDAAVWGGDQYISKDWQTVGGLGFAGAGHLKIATKTAQFSWAATDFLFSQGSGI